MKNGDFWVVTPCGPCRCARMLRRAALVRNDVSEVIIGTIIRVTRIGELETSAVTRN
jgi:hypothetical protein